MTDGGWIIRVWLVLAMCCSGAIAAEDDRLQRVAVLGASVSDGFFWEEPLGGPRSAGFRLEHYLSGALSRPHEPIFTRASRFLFMKPLETMRKQVDEVAVHEPTLVVAVDAMFWFCYGDGMTGEQRLERFEQGLKLLEEIQAPMVLGDIPDASAAVGKMLNPGQVPEKAALEACNKRLTEWAANRENVTVLPLSALMDRAARDEELKLGEQTVPAGSTAALLQHDRLHPTQRGLAVIAIAVLDAAGAVIGHEPERDVDKVLAAALAKAEPAGKPAAPNENRPPVKVPSGGAPHGR